MVELRAEMRRALVVKAQAGSAGISLETQDNQLPHDGCPGPAHKTLLARIPADVPCHIDKLLETFDTLTSSESCRALRPRASRPHPTTAWEELC